uniref:G_PROTEIN_RECEP_F1_2 domain-containing protein n=1 Tax=Elaeophora elaphi TaxID=1147741 RepID=A0A0R3RZ38_9BILA
MFGLGPWWYNFSQFQRSELTVDNLISVPSPYIELTIFGTFKAAEFLSFVGGCIVHPVYRLFLLRNLTPEKASNNSVKIIREKCRKIQGRFLLASFIIGPLSTLASVSYYSLDRKDAKELCYQIRCNEQMMVWDRTAISLGFVGWYWKRFKGAVDGVNLASIYTAYYFTIQKRLMNTPTTDKIKPLQRPKSLEEADEAKNLTFLMQTVAENSKSLDLTASLRTS